MQSKDFLFEIGVEELPAGYIKPALQKMESSLQNSFKEYKLKYKNFELFCTPRRLAVRVNSLQSEQENETIKRVGPTSQIAYNEDGSLSKAALGFLRGAGASAADIYEVETPKGNKIAVKIFKKGKSTQDLLPDICQKAITNINFPKLMKWGTCKQTFARPIRWLVAIFEEDLVNFSYAGVATDKTSFGNRFLKLENPVAITSAADYETKLNKVGVVSSFWKRKMEIENQLEHLFQNRDEQLVQDTKLLEIVTNLVESPQAVLADFDGKYLALPDKIITSTLSQHQKYFSVQNKDGSLCNKFVFISNGDPQFSKIIKQGNEKVIKARLEDAEFYFKEDTKQPLEKFVPKLADVTFQAELGSLWEKTERVQAVVKFICKEMQLANATCKNALRAAFLCKADLVTNMLGEKEFTKLQGYMGSKYALLSKEDPKVAAAIYEHYQPRGQNDDLPASLPGAIVAIADKIDTVTGIMGIGMLPTGSNDPFALRRAANGIVQIIGDKKLDIDLHQLIETAFANLNPKLPKQYNNKNKVYEYFKQRVHWYLKQSKLDYDVIDSVMHINYADIPDLKQRALDLQKFKANPNFDKLVVGFKRVSNIISEQKNFSELNTQLLQENAEKQLYEQYLALKAKVEEHLPQKNYSQIMQELVSFRTHIDNFFDEVLVNVEDNDLRQNRYTLLKLIRELFLKVADIALIVFE
jgi:glycyl-tRNA synthetase beta chain